MRIASVKPNDLAVVNDEDFILGIGIVTDFDLFRPRGKEGKNPVARRRSTTLGPYVS